MTDPDLLDTTIGSFGDLPMQPTGSGAADLEISYEQMRLAEDGDGHDRSRDIRGKDEITSDSKATTPTQDVDAAADSAAHPS